MKRCVLQAMLSLSIFFGPAGVALGVEMLWVDKSDCRKLIDQHNYADALKVCTKAAKEGELSAMFNLSTMYGKGWGVARDETMDLKWLQTAAAKRYPWAEYVLSSRYASGAGVPKDANRSRELLEDAAGQGLLIAQVMLGRFYMVGYAKLGIEKDAKQAIAWFNKAVQQCNACNFELWRIYFFGKGVKKDATLANRYLMKAAEVGLPKAQMQLGFRYYHGEGVPKDLVLAYKWMALAKAGGDPFAKKALHPLERKMSFSQIRRSKKLVQEYMRQAAIESQQICAIYDKFCGSEMP